MKNLYAFYFLLSSVFIVAFAPVNIYALDYTIAFTGTGATSSVESVIVQNLTKGTTVTVPAGNVLNLTSVITSVDNPSSNVEGICISPNPIQDNATVSFFAKQDGLTQISAYSIDGRKVVGHSEILLRGYNSFKLSIPKGIFLIKVQGNGFSYSTKAVSQSTSASIPKISISSKEHVSSIKPQKSKNAVTYMLYSTGDQLLYKGKSGNYCTIVTDKPEANKITNFDFIECKDADNNYYSVVKIGTQVWMAENLITNKFRTNDLISYVTVATSWSTATFGTWCNYDNLSANSTNYGHLYNWYAASDSRNIAPVGWHVPNDTEWTTLTTFLGGEAVAGGKLKDIGTTYWTTPNFGATNESGFTGLPGGYRTDDGSYGVIGGGSYWWSSSENSPSNSWYRYIYKNYSDVYKASNGKASGFSIRCVLDNVPTLSTTAASAIAITTATSGGNVTVDGGLAITSRGICWDTYTLPTVQLSTKTTETGTTGAFTSSMTNLTANTKYFVRSYATNSAGTAYGAEISFTTLNAASIVDIDGNTYSQVTIGTQTWMCENLKTTKYSNGDAILSPAGDWSALTTGAQAAYANNAANATKYGLLYNWYAVSDSRNIAPVGWHVASDAEWTTLENYVATHLGTSLSVAKALTANTEWATYSVNGTVGHDLFLNNSTGFSALPGGYRGDDGDGSFIFLGSYGSWWSCTTYNTSSAWLRNMGYNNSTVERDYTIKQAGFSVRCVKD